MKDESPKISMRGMSHRVHLALFLAAVFVPCVVLVALSLRVVSQDRELRTKRHADERRLIVGRAREGLLAALGTIRSDETAVELEPGQAYRHPETVFVAWSEAGRIVLPWEPEKDRAVRHGREEIAGLPAIHGCEQAGIQARETTACYQRILQGRIDSYQAAYISWLLAQALESNDQRARALPLFRGLLDGGSAVTDADGIPLSLHAARALAQQGQADAQTVHAVDLALSDRPWVPPMSLFVITEIAERLARNARAAGQKQAAEQLNRRVAAKVQILQQAESLQNDFPRISAVLANRAPPGWAPFGDDIWLIGSTGDPGKNSTILAVRGQDVFQRLAIPGAVRLADARVPEGEPLGEAFPDLKLVVAASDAVSPNPPVDLQRRVLYVALAAVVAVTMFAAYLLWRDLRREMLASELRSQFVASVSHELKTPLTAIRMFAETLQLGRCTDPEVQSEYLGTIVSECERLSRLVDGVLMFSKSEQGKKIFRFRPVQPLDAARAAARAMDGAMTEQGFRLHLKADDGLPEINADQDALQQAILNLLSNAVKFSGYARDIEVELYREGQEVVVRVRDHGIGIAREEHARIFDKFYRAPTPENQLLPGSGLGLALVSQIAKAHGGQVAVESELGQGSTFYLRLPISAAAERKQEVKV